MNRSQLVTAREKLEEALQAGRNFYPGATRNPSDLAVDQIRAALATVRDLIAQVDNGTYPDTAP